MALQSFVDAYPSHDVDDNGYEIHNPRSLASAASLARDVLSQPCAAPPVAAWAPPVTDTIRDEFRKQFQWSRATFGEGYRMVAILQHIRDELAEVKAKPDDPVEWIDVALLALDGAWRCRNLDADSVMALMVEKMRKNRTRKWAPVTGDEPCRHVEESALPVSESCSGLSYSQTQGDAVRASVANAAHVAWSGWIKYEHSKCSPMPNGSLVIPADLVTRWKRQSLTDYENLPASEKVSDLKEADRYLDAVRAHLPVPPDASDLLAQERAEIVRELEQLMATHCPDAFQLGYALAIRQAAQLVADRGRK
jgi:hypothetical protein